MSFETSGIEGWLDAHPAEYAILFDDGEIREDLTGLEPDKLAMTALTRRITRHKTRGDQYEIAQLTQGTTNLLDACSDGVFGPAHSILVQDSRNKLDLLKVATANVVRRWEIACSYHDLASPFAELLIEDIQPEDINHQATRLVLMTAVSILYAAKECRGIPRWTFQSVKHFGPSFAVRLMRRETLPASWGITLGPGLIGPRKRSNLLGSNTRSDTMRSSIIKLLAKLPSGRNFDRQAPRPFTFDTITSDSASVVAKEELALRDKLELWILAHPEDYALLFDDGTISKEALRTAQPESLTLAGLSRLSKQSTHSLSYANELKRSVRAILDASRDGSEQNPAFMQDISEERLESLKDRVAWVITAWEGVSFHKRLLSPLVNARNELGAPTSPVTADTGLVLMAAAALLHAAQSHGNSDGIIKDSAKRGVKNYGPAFVQNFLQGRLSPKTRLGIDAELLSTMDVASRKRILQSHTLSIGPIIIKIATNLQEYATQHLADSLDWPASRVEQIFTPDNKYRFAVHWLHTPPKEMAERVKYLYEEVYTPESLAAHLQTTPIQAARLFLPHVITRIIGESPFAKDPMARPRTIVKTLQELTNEYGLGYNLACRLATYSLERARRVARAIKEEEVNRPSNVAPGLWNYAVAAYPTPGDKRRHTYISNSLSYWNLLQVSTLNISRFEEKAYDTLADTTYMPEEVLFGNNDTEDLRAQVQSITAKSGLTSQQTAALLEYFAQPGEAMPPYIAKLIGRLQRTAQADKA